MADDIAVSKRLDALVIEPRDEVLEQRAAAPVCIIMSRTCHTNQQIRDVLSALGLPTWELPA